MAVKDIDRQDTPGRRKDSRLESDPAKSQRKSPAPEAPLKSNQEKAVNARSNAAEAAADKLRKAVEKATEELGHSEVRQTVDRALVDLEYVDRRDLPPALK